VQNRTWRAVPVLLIAIALAAGACSSTTPSSAPGSAGSAAPSGSTPGTAVPPSFVPDLAPVHAVGGDRPHFEDKSGREVLLRGVNVNSFGDYFQADPKLPSTVPVTDADWDSMAALGFSAVRFIVNWSALEPQKGVYDQAYIDKVRTGIEKAGKRGIYVVVDMHQDAWGKYIASPAGQVCSDDAEAAIGWDGAPEWATFKGNGTTDTCRAKGGRELSEAVGQSFRNFYDDKDGIRTALASAWGHLAGKLADEPAVIGYDLLNEPNGVAELATLRPKYETFLTDSIAAIRKAESAAGIGPRIAFVEPIVLWPLPNTAPAVGFTADPQIAFAPHNYFESISKLLKLEAGFTVSADYAKKLGAPLWIGEYGWWDDGAESMERLHRYAKTEDELILGGAWWQWRQACGDPHTLNNPERKTSNQLHLNGVGCPGDKDKGITKAYATVLSRAYPRAAPGAIESIVSDPDARTATVLGEVSPTAVPSGRLALWVPDNGKGAPAVSVKNLSDVKTEAVRGGFYVTASVAPGACRYEVSIDAPAAASGGPALTC
jgi:endoglycosylceramidase